MNVVSNRELLLKAEALVRSERKITLEILNCINEVFRRRAYVEAGFPNLFEWLTKGLGYSEAAASRRLRSAELLRAVPETAEKIATGELNLSGLSMAQSVIRQEEKRSGEKMNHSMKAKVVEKIEACTQREAEKNLAALFPEVVSKKESIRAIDETHVRVQVTLTQAQLQKIERPREVLSHAHPSASIADIVEIAVDALLKRKDPLAREIKPRGKSVKTTGGTGRVVSAGSGEASPNETRTPSETRNPGMTHFASVAEVTNDGHPLRPNTKPIKPSTRNLVFRKAEAQCEYVDPLTGRRCCSRYHLEPDHVVPRALGGSSESENLRAYCRAHNNHAAERVFGKPWMQQFRKSREVDEAYERSKEIGTGKVFAGSHVLTHG